MSSTTWAGACEAVLARSPTSPSAASRPSRRRERSVIASASGSQLASYAWGAAKVIFIAGAEKLVPSIDVAHERVFEHSLVLEDARAFAAYGENSRVGKILEIHQEDLGRIHVVLIRRSVGF